MRAGDLRERWGFGAALRIWCDRSGMQFISVS